MPLQIRRGIEADRVGIVFDEGEPIYTTDTKRFFIGDGTTLGGVDPSIVTDGDKGDITVSASGTVWSIDNGVVDVPKIDATGTADATTFLRGDGSWSVPTVTDGDKGDITVSSSGAVWTIDNGVVGVAKINATGTADATTFFRGDGSWATPTVTDGDKGDITVSSSGTVWTIDNATIDIPKISATGTADATTFLRGDGSWSVPSGGGGGFTPVRQAYTATTSGIAIPVGAKRLRILAWGGGGGGGGGALNGTTSNRCGGAGGAGCSIFVTDWDVTMLSGTLSVVIGAGGTGGNGATTSGGTPVSGTSGGTSSVTGTWNGVSTRLCYGFGGNGGGVSATGTSSPAGASIPQGYQGGGGGNGATTAGALGSNSAGPTGLSIAGYGGGGGGGVTSGNTQAAGGASFGNYIAADANVAGGTAGGGAGGSEAMGRGTNWDYARAGGGGGGGNNGGTGGAGGTGGYGSGGGGGGGGTLVLTNTGGRGGDGGQGLVILYWS